MIPRPHDYTSCGESLYHEKGLRQLSPVLKDLALLDFTFDELRIEAMLRASEMSIQGVQPKLSDILNIKECRFEIAEKNGRYILKPQHYFFP